MTTAQNPMLVAQHLSKQFGALPVIRDLSISFEKGTVTAIVGDNGAGKSTLLKMLSGQYAPDSGAVLLNGRTLNASTSLAHRDAGIEMVYQDFALAKSHDVVSNLFMGREQATDLGFLRRTSMFERAERILRELGIDIPDLRRPVGRLSGGQQQAVAIARAVLFDPQVLLLDEPTAALAAREVDRVLDLVRRERAAGRAIVLVSHRLNDVFTVSDRVVVLKRGEIFSDDQCSAVSLAETVQRIVS